MEHVTNSKQVADFVTIEQRWPDSYYMRSIDGFDSVAHAMMVLPTLKSLPENIASGATFQIIKTERVLTTVSTLTITRLTISAPESV